MPLRALIFDFDGVIADSEVIANAVLAEFITRLGFPTTLDDALARYVGKPHLDKLAAIERDLGRTLPSRFSNELEAAIVQRFRLELCEVQGASEFIRRTANIPRCIASSSGLAQLQLCLDLLGLMAEFGSGNVLSATMVNRGKPHPDIFLLAAERMEIAPQECLVFEDSIAGVQGAVAAGTTVIGLCAGSHVRSGHADLLRVAGAAYICETWDDAARLTSVLLQLHASHQHDG
jgi:HAD superfamily hydrolase (TIGR01549 family)